MGFNSLDDLITQISAGKYARIDSAKITNPVATAGGWHNTAVYNGSPNITAFPSAQDLVQQQCTELGGDSASASLFGIQNAGLPGGSATKHILNVGAMLVAAAGAPWQLKLVDMLYYYKMSGANVTGAGTTRTLINSNTSISFSSSTGLLVTYTNDFNTFSQVQFSVTGGTLPTGLSLLTDYWLVRVNATTSRIATSLANAIAGTVIAYTDGGSGTMTMTLVTPRYADGVGTQAFFSTQVLPTAGGPQLTASSYTNSDGVNSRAFQGTPVMNATANAYISRIIHSGNAAGNYGPFLPLRGGDKGIKSIESFVWNNGTAYTGTGVINLCVVRPLLDLALPVTGMWSERDLVNQLPSLPQVRDGACLVWLLFGAGATTANSPLNTTIDFAWGG